MNKDVVSRHFVKHKTYTQISDLMTNKNGTFKSNVDRISVLGLNCMFYLVLEKEIGTAIYNDNLFFKWLFDLFLEKSKHFNDRRFWIRNKLKAQNENKKEEDEKSSDAPQYNTDEDCRLISELLRVLFNFTLIQTNVLKFKLDTFPPDYQRAVVGRAVRLLTVPCQWEPEFHTKCAADIKHLLDVPGLIGIKIKLCNVALYDGDILGMNLVPESAVPVCDLLTFYCMQTRENTQTAQQVAATMMFLKVCSPKVVQHGRMFGS